MTLDIIQERMNEYELTTKIEEENAFKEICQEIALAGLSRTDFFRIASFQGGTCLRIVHNLKRFSEDMDFVLQSIELNFNWEIYLEAIQAEFHAYGLNCDTKTRQDAPGAIKKAFLKEDSFGTVLNLRYGRTRSDRQKILIKLEVDTHPPEGALFETHYLNYPYAFPVVSHDLESLFAGKCHALLCREYVKGRDWYDFLWYVRKKVQLNYSLLKHALEQCGPYQGQDLPISRKWVIDALTSKVEMIDWKHVCEDVSRFISSRERHSLEHWSPQFFSSFIAKVP